MHRYKAVFLDWDDTIGDWTHAEHLALRDIYTHWHLDTLYPDFEAYHAAYKSYNLPLWERYGRGEVSKEQLHFERFYKPLLCGEPDTEKTQQAHQMGAEFLRLTNHYFSLMPDAERVVRYLASKYPLTIVSNGFKEVQYYKFAHSGLQDYLTHIVISDEIGVTKPRPEIFRIALERNGVRPEDAVMIGDSYSSDIQGARSAGIDQIWIRDERRHEARKSNETATFVLPRLADVMNIL